MCRYIDVDEITKDVKTFQNSFVLFAGATGEQKIVFIGKPTDVRPNIHATWEETSAPIDSKYGKHNYVCPKCFRDPLYFVGGTEDWWCIDKPHFCPNCGADMREPKGEKSENV